MGLQGFGSWGRKRNAGSEITNSLSPWDAACASCFTYKKKCSFRHPEGLCNPAQTERGYKGRDQMHSWGMCLLSVGCRGGCCAKSPRFALIGSLCSQDFLLSNAKAANTAQLQRYLPEPCPPQVTDVLIHKTPLWEQVAGISSASSTFPLHSSPHVVFFLFQSHTVIPLPPLGADPTLSSPSPCLHENTGMETEGWPGSAWLAAR